MENFFKDDSEHGPKNFGFSDGTFFEGQQYGEPPSDTEEMFAHLLFKTDFEINEIEEISEYELDDSERESVLDLLQTKERAQEMLDQYGQAFNQSNILYL
jgi:hypothetical protein